MADGFRFEQDGPVGVLTLDAPPVNLFSAALVESLERSLDEIEAAGPRALLLRAEGKVFTGGVDVNTFDGLSESDASEFCERLLQITHRVEDLPFPTIACVHGLCLTAGFELSLACDMIWAAESARFGLVEIVVGVSPFMGGTQRVAERAGPARARELVMSGGLYDAAVLERWNVVNRVLPDDELADKTMRFAERLANGPTLANVATKRVVRAFLDGGVRGADAETCGIVAPLFETEDLPRAVRTFLDEGPGKATFEGR
ncbi:MAG TPA: enoyl-CoA hydratase/isomerase family protein [Thermoleophilaceae bacterium]